jgi:hypothetical protein
VVGAATIAAAYFALNADSLAQDEATTESGETADHVEVETLDDKDDVVVSLEDSAEILPQVSSPASSKNCEPAQQMTAEQKAKLAKELQSVTVEIATQMQSIQQEMNSMRAQIHDQSGLGGLRKELDAMKQEGLEKLESRVQGLAASSPRQLGKYNSVEMSLSGEGALLDKLDDEAAEEEADRPLQCGDVVNAQWKGEEQFFPATIASVNPDNTFNLHYHDGGRERNVHERHICKHGESQPPSAFMTADKSPDASIALKNQGVRRRNNNISQGQEIPDLSEIPGLSGENFDPVAFEKYMR